MQEVVEPVEEAALNRVETIVDGHATMRGDSALELREEGKRRRAMSRASGFVGSRTSVRDALHTGLPDCGPSST